MERASLSKKNKKTLKTVLVTGGAGFIGSHIVDLLCAVGHRVRVIDDLSFGYKDFIHKRSELIHGSIGDRALLEKALPGVDLVIHLAAHSIIKFSFEKPQAYFENNVLNGIVLLEAMRKHNVQKIINSSTAAVYGLTQTVPLKETDPTLPVTIYGSSKLAFEYALHSYYYSFGIHSVSLRYFNAYGPRDEQQPATRAVPIWIKAILKNQPVPLYWNGEQLRDYVYVSDIAQAHLDVMDLTGVHVFNIGSGKGVFMKDILNELEKISGRRIETRNKGERPGDPHTLVADTHAIQKAVGWNPQVSLADGLRKTFNYYTLSS